MIDAGLPLVTGLTALYEQCDPRRQLGLKRTIGDLSARVQSGDSFYEAILKHPRIFNRLYVAMVKAGESGGMLAEILDRLAGFLEASARLAQEDQIRDDLSRDRGLYLHRHHDLPDRPRGAGIRPDFRRTSARNSPRPTQFLHRPEPFRHAGTGITSSAASRASSSRIRNALRTKRGRETWDRWKLKLPDLRPADSQDLHDPLRADLRAIDPKRRADPGGDGNRGRDLGQLRDGIRHQGRERGRGKRRADDDRDVQAEDFPPDVAADDLRR